MAPAFVFKSTTHVKHLVVYLFLKISFFSRPCFFEFIIPRHNSKQPFQAKALKMFMTFYTLPRDYHVVAGGVGAPPPIPVMYANLAPNKTSPRIGPGQLVPYQEPTERRVRIISGPLATKAPVRRDVRRVRADSAPLLTSAASSTTTTTTHRSAVPATTAPPAPARPLRADGAIAAGAVAAHLVSAISQQQPAAKPPARVTLLRRDPKPEPVPAPEPAPEHVSKPAPEPVPEPEPAPKPVPEPEAAPKPVPEPEVAPKPVPEPEVAPNPVPEPASKPGAQPDPEPDAQPEPEAELMPTPEPEAEPMPTPEPAAPTPMAQHAAPKPIVTAGARPAPKLWSSIVGSTVNATVKPVRHVVNPPLQQVIPHPGRRPVAPKPRQLRTVPDHSTTFMDTATRSPPRDKPKYMIPKPIRRGISGTNTFRWLGSETSEDEEGDDEADTDVDDTKDETDTDDDNDDDDDDDNKDDDDDDDSKGDGDAKKGDGTDTDDETFYTPSPPPPPPPVSRPGPDPDCSPPPMTLHANTKRPKARSNKRRKRKRRRRGQGRPAGKTQDKPHESVMTKATTHAQVQVKSIIDVLREATDIITTSNALDRVTKANRAKILALPVDTPGRDYVLSVMRLTRYIALVSTFLQQVRMLKHTCRTKFQCLETQLQQLHGAGDLLMALVCRHPGDNAVMFRPETQQLKNLAQRCASTSLPKDDGSVRDRYRITSMLQRLCECVGDIEAALDEICGSEEEGLMQPGMYLDTWVTVMGALAWVAFTWAFDGTATKPPSAHDWLNHAVGHQGRQLDNTAIYHHISKRIAPAGVEDFVRRFASRAPTDTDNGCEALCDSRLRVGMLGLLAEAGTIDLGMIPRLHMMIKPAESSLVVAGALYAMMFGRRQVFNVVAVRFGGTGCIHNTRLVDAVLGGIRIYHHQ